MPIYKITVFNWDGMQKEEKNTAIYVAYEGEQSVDPVRPEKNLLFAILLSAINDLNKIGGDQRRAVEYFLSPEEDYIFSFRSICDTLRLDPSKILYITGLNQPKHKARKPLKLNTSALRHPD